MISFGMRLSSVTHAEQPCCFDAKYLRQRFDLKVGNVAPPSLYFCDTGAINQDAAGSKFPG